MGEHERHGGPHSPEKGEDGGKGGILGVPDSSSFSSPEGWIWPSSLTF